jgi:WXXGXW repeat (2 copies)
MRITAFFAALLLALIALSAPPTSSAQVRITVGFGPPALPVYEQPLCPGDGYIWTPGYWAWDPDDEDYYWVPGTWVLAPEVGYLWTPPWWDWDNGVFLFHEGYWGPHIGFYGGINYGFGYFGFGFVGGRWEGGHFFYNRDVANINVVNIHNVYNEHVNVTVNHISYNGGKGGIEARPRPEDELADRDRHIGAVAAQTEHINAARGNRELRASVNQGRPPIAATGRPGEFSSHEVVASREAGAPYHPPANRGNAGARTENAARPAAEGGGHTYNHVSEVPPLERPAAPNTGNAKLDQKYQKQQQKLYDQQNKDRQKLQAQQEKEHQQAQQRNANAAAKQQMEQRHQQQTQQMVQRHTQQRQQLQQRQAPRQAPAPREHK